jgi:SlyX protein
MMSDNNTDQRLSELEIQIAQQNETIDNLNDAVVSQWKEIDRLTRHVKILNEQVLSLEDEASPHKVTKPPHY